MGQEPTATIVATGSPTEVITATIVATTKKPGPAVEQLLYNGIAVRSRAGMGGGPRAGI